VDRLRITRRGIAFKHASISQVIVERFYQPEEFEELARIPRDALSRVEQMIGLDRSARWTHCHRPLDFVSQLPHVAGPPVSREQIERG